MKFFKNIALGFVSYKGSIDFIIKYRMWMYFIWPLVFSSALFYLKYIIDKDIPVINYSVSELSNLSVDHLIVLLKLSISFIINEYSKYIVLIIMSPFMAYASAKVERLLTGYRNKFQLKQWWNDIKRALHIAFRNLLAQSLLVLLWYICVLIFPVLTDYSRWMVLVIGFYFYGFSLLDYSMERRNFTIQKSVKWVRKNRGLALTLGAVFSGFFFIDIYHYPVGVIFAPLLGIVASTLAMNKKESLTSSSEVNNANK